MPIHEHTMIDGGAYGVSIVAHITYSIARPSGDGREEPRDPGGPVLQSVKLELRETSLSVPQMRALITDPVPEWIFSVLEDQNWHEDIDREPYDDADDRRDSARDLDLVEGR